MHTNAKMIKAKIDILKSPAASMVTEYGRYQFACEKEKSTFLKYYDEIKEWLIKNGYGMPKKKYVKVMSRNRIVHQDGTTEEYTSDFDIKNEYTMCFGRTYMTKHVVYAKELDRFFIWMERCVFTKKEGHGESEYCSQIVSTNELCIVLNEDTFEYFSVKDGGIYKNTPSYYEYFDNLGNAVMEKHNLYSSIVWLNNSKSQHFTAIETPQSYNRWKTDRKEIPEDVDCTKEIQIPNYTLSPLNDINEYQKHTIEIHDALGGTVIAEKLNKNLLVFRLICCNCGDINEMMRIYVDDEKISAYKVNDNGEFKGYNLAEHTDICRSFLLPTINTKLLDGIKLEYCKSFINKIKDKNALFVLINALIDPRIEQLCKIGFTEALDSVLYCCKNMEQLTDSLLLDGSKENVYQWLGVNKHQVTELLKLEYKNNILDFLSDVKKWILLDNDCKTIADLDIQTFKQYLNMVIHSHMKNYGYMGPSLEYNNIFTIRKAISNYVLQKNENGAQLNESEFDKMAIQYIPKLYEMATDEARIIHFYTDYVLSIFRCPPANWKLFPENKDDIIRLHDDASSIMEVKKTEHLKNGFDKNITKVKDLAFNKDEQFAVVVPTKMEDFIEEGLALKHCVKSYIYHVAEGKTNVVMIRKKDDLLTPFFTVEVDNNRVIQQVHGFGNCFANTVPGLTDFVAKWALEKNLIISNINKVR